MPTHEELLKLLVLERFGPPVSLERERTPTPWEILRRRRILLGTGDRREEAV